MATHSLREIPNSDEDFMSGFVRGILSAIIIY